MVSSATLSYNKEGKRASGDADCRILPGSSGLQRLRALRLDPDRAQQEGGEAGTVRVGALLRPRSSCLGPCRPCLAATRNFGRPGPYPARPRPAPDPPFPPPATHPPPPSPPP